jgi:glycosyltransferase involved in cell wall biosynthesis
VISLCLVRSVARAVLKFFGHPVPVRSTTLVEMSGRTWLIAQLDAMHQSRGGDWYYRTFAPGRALADLEDVYVVNLDQAHRSLPRVLELADVLVINGACYADLLPVMQRRKQLGRVTVFEINDDVAAIQPSNPLAGFFGQPENLRLFRRLALTAEGVQYSVPELQRLYGGLNSRGCVFLNQLVEPPALGPLRSGGEVVVGWGGSAGHFDDMAEVAPDLIRFLLEEPRVTLHLMCSDKIWSLFAELPAARKRRTPVGSIEDYYAFASQLDIGIAPNRDAGFNRARSDVKFLEYAALGAVAVVQRLTPYTGSVLHGENGFLFASSQELVELLSRLTADRAERERVRARAHAYVSTERRQGPHAAERLAFYSELWPQSGSASDAAGLFSELSLLDGATVHGRHVVLEHTRYETLLHDGLVLLQGTQRERGEALLREAATLQPESAMPWLFLGVQLERESDLRAALSRDPRSLQACLALGRHYLSRGAYKEALQLFLSGAELAPGYEMPFAYASVVVQKLGATREAREFDELAQRLAAPVMPAGASG